SATAAGGKVTMGNAYTGNSTTVCGITAGKPGEPPRSIVGAKGDNGGVVAVGGPGDKQVYGTKDGNVYRRDNGQWQQVSPPSAPERATAYSAGNPSPSSSVTNRPTASSQLPGGG